MSGDNDDFMCVGYQIIRPVGYEPLRDGILKLQWPSGAIAVLTIDDKIAGRRAVSFALADDGSDAPRTEYTFADCFSESGDGQWDPIFLARLAKEQGRPFE